MTFNDLTPLRRVEEMRADFIANASHELRTPLAALLGFIETLQGTAKDDAVARDKFLAIMQRAGHPHGAADRRSARRCRASSSMRICSRTRRSISPRSCARWPTACRRWRATATSRSRWRCRAEPLIVLGDRDELIRALENLVENALKYGAAGKRVDVTLTRGQTRAGTPEARLAVRDYGPGIAPEHLPRLTERFYRVDVADSRAQGGTGLGLALVKHVLNRHGGRLTIESTPGAGATFTMHLPLRTADSSSTNELLKNQ